MLYQQISHIAPPLSRISFGGAAVSGEGGGYGFGAMRESQSESLLKAAWEAGINVFDTAPIYGFGLSEERFGRYLPQDAFIVTKGGVDWHANKRVNMSNDPAVIERMLLESLKRLNRDTVDLYMIHWPDPRVDIRSSLEVVRRYQDSGAVRYIGLCNTNPQDLMRAREIVSVVSIQSELNLYNQRAYDILENQWQDLFSMGWGTLDKGILSGRVHELRRYDEHDARSWAPWWNKKEVAIKIEKVARLRTILDEYSLTLTQFCLQYNLQHFGISSCLVGLKSIDDLVEMTSNLQKIIPAHTMEEVLLRWNR
jgi:aryl-alcohol dehydrogenase-like predicted oxidoreductase